MKKAGRDNFSTTVIKTLERRVNSKCSNPDCRMPTSGPTVKPNKANNVGVAAHIMAAAAGGPRYNEQLTPQERAGIDNAIWLCSNCSIKIDRDVEKYSVALLRRWKVTAEDHADKEFGKAPLSRDDYAVLEALALGSMKKTGVSDAVSRISNLTAAEMGKLDPRFIVEVGYQKGVTSYTFNPIQPVNMALKIIPEFSAEFTKKYSDLLNHGKELNIDIKSTKVEGSPLFDFQENIKGKMVISTHARKPAVMKCVFEAKENGPLTQVDDVHGEMVGGAQSATFNGSICGGIITLTQTTFFAPAEEGRASVCAAADLTLWQGRPLRTIPYFDKVYAFFEALTRGEKLVNRIEVEGVEMISAAGSFDFDELQKGQYSWIFRHIRNARAILELLGTDVSFDENPRHTWNEIKFVEEVYQLLFSQRGLRGKKIATATITMTISPNASQDEISNILGEPRAIIYELEYKTPLNLFGRMIELPLVRLTYTLATLRKIGAAGKIEPGKAYQFKVLPSEGCEFIADCSTVQLQ